MEQNRTARFFVRLAAILLALALLSVCFAIVKVQSIIGKILLFVAAALAVLLSAFLILLVILAKRAQKHRHNFFLYDRKMRGNMPTEELTVEHISNRLMSYMGLFRHHKQLYISTLFDESGGAPESFKPLFCYQLLGMLSVGAEDQLCAFLEGGKELADIFSNYLTQAGEDELSRDVQSFIASYDGKTAASFGTYLRLKSDYLAERMLSYTKEHIHDFD